MKPILLDVNVVLDVLLDRKPHVAGSAAIWAIAEHGKPRALLAAHGITTIHYLLRKELGTGGARRAVAAILRVFGIASVDEKTIRDALDLAFADFEDAVAAAAARNAGCDCVVTRDPGGFRNSPVRVLTPEAAAHLYARRRPEA
jgi:predicted nucleic acid-binding protein